MRAGFDPLDATSGAGSPRQVDAIDPRQARVVREFFHAALARGVYLPPSGFEVLFLSLAHDEATLARAADALADGDAERRHS